VFAHRGGSKLAPENTLAAFDNGMRLGADGFELDVQLSADGVPVAMHDAVLDRTTVGAGPVSSRTVRDLERVDAGYRFGADRGFPFRGQGIGVPALETVLTRHPFARAIIEMKGGALALVRAVVDVVRRVDAIDRVCLGSYHLAALQEARRLEPAIATSASQQEAQWALYRSWVRWPFAGPRPYAAFQVPEQVGRLRVVTPRFVRHVHREGQVVQVWVVDTADDVRRLVEWGVDGVISDRPDITVPIVTGVGRQESGVGRESGVGSREPEVGSLESACSHPR
jgi:glycerophosphoryl diester phosphodiesterase